MGASTKTPWSVQQEHSSIFSATSSCLRVQERLRLRDGSADQPLQRHRRSCGCPEHLADGASSTRLLASSKVSSSQSSLDPQLPLSEVSDPPDISSLADPDGSFRICMVTLGPRSRPTHSIPGAAVVSLTIPLISSSAQLNVTVELQCLMRWKLLMAAPPEVLRRVPRHPSTGYVQVRVRLPRQLEHRTRC